MEFTSKFNKINKENVDIAGGKGASLGEMTQSKIPVPPGFVILSTAFEEFITLTDLNVEIGAVLDTVKHEEVHTVAQWLLARNMDDKVLPHEIGVFVRSDNEIERAKSDWVMDGWLNTLIKIYINKRRDKVLL